MRVARFGLLISLVASSLLVASCASDQPVQQSANKGIVFDPSSQNALITISGPPGMPSIRELKYKFRRINLEDSSFGKEFFEIGFSRSGSTNGLELRPASGKWDGKRVAFSAKIVPAGDYVLVSSYQFLQNTPTSTLSQGRCFGARAPVFRLAAGQLSLVETHYDRFFLRIKPSDQTLADFDATRADYPGLTGDVHLSKPTTLVKWQVGEPAFLGKSVGDTSHCEPKQSFTILPPES